MQRPTTVFCVSVLLASSFCPTGWTQSNSVEQALSEVRKVKSDLFSRQSSVLGILPGPREMAAHQLRCRPLPEPAPGPVEEFVFDQETVQRAAALDPAALRKSKGRMGLRVLPLGITGAYVTEALNQRELIVVHVLDHSPASDKLQPDDLVIGANGRLFIDPEDPRPEMGNALVESQSPERNGLLTLQIVRERTPINVQIELSNSVSYSDKWPFDCPQSKRVRREALDSVISRYPWHRYDFWTPLFLLASGDDRALELVRRHLCGNIQQEYPESHGGATWRTSYHLISLCEYYLQTGDSFVLPAIRYDAETLAWAQYRSGSWSHGGGEGTLAPGMVSGGYGEINCAGLGAFIGLCLARQCGIEPYENTLPQAIRFFGNFCGSNFPYGLGSPSGRGGRMDNGMNSMAAVAFHLLGEDEMAKRWARTVCCMWMGRERGHAEAIFSAAWGPIGAALAPEPEFHAFMQHMLWAYEMGRTRDGGLTFMRGSRWTEPNMTAAMGLFLYLPERRLQILGGNSVFAQQPPEELRGAALCYRNKQWAELKELLADYQKRADASTSPDAMDYANGLAAAYERLEEHYNASLKMVETSIREGKLATAQTQLDLLAKLVGEEREPAKRLRNKLGDGELKDTNSQTPPSLIDEQDIIKRMELAKGGVGDGFAHSPAYIVATNKQGFDGMEPEEIAGFLAHPSSGPAGGAAAALAERGEAVLPLLERLLSDTHCGIRAGAIDALTAMHASDADEYRSEIPAELEEVIALVRPMISDPSALVRDAAGRFVQSIKVLNADIYEMLTVMATDGANVQNVVRYGVKDPAIRTRLCMAMLDAANRRKSTVPADYKPMVIATSAHLELCRPYLRSAIETLNNQEVLNMYGFFSNHPPAGALKMLDRYSEDPLVITHLPDVLRFAARKRGSMDSYWHPIIEYPHRIVMRLGPDAIPIVQEFCRSERALYRQIAAKKAEQPTWWKEDSLTFLEDWRREMERTIQVVRCLHGLVPPEETLRSLVAVYLDDRSFGAWERSQIRDYLARQGDETVPTIRQTLTSHMKTRTQHFDQQLAQVRTELQATEDRQQQRQLTKQIEEIESQLASFSNRVSELRELMDLIAALAATSPDAEQVRVIAEFYVKSPWENRYPYEEYRTSNVRRLYETQLTQIRDTLQRWGPSALPALREFQRNDEETLKTKLKSLDEEEEFWKPQWARKSALPLARIAQERLDLVAVRDELDHVVTLLTCIEKDQLSTDQIAAICRIYTRHQWSNQRKLIRELLSHRNDNALATIQQHIKQEQSALATVSVDVDRLMSDTARERVKWQYDRVHALQQSMQTGLRDLRRLLQASPSTIPQRSFDTEEHAR